ncbi:MAG TPA: SMC-Scp complex subunit ScpB [Syntrophomonadaceae bacterium]|nr:SMC-Scp complex subunit ScpB [Syntrophomonadaceae bacterium]
MLMRDEIKAAIEAILFVHAEEVSMEKLIETLDVPLVDLKDILQEMMAEYNDKKRGIRILRGDEGYTLCTKSEFSDVLNRMIQPVRKKLSPAALETLAIIAYRQPVTRLEIENIRGVKSDKIVSNLLDRGIIQEAGHKDVVGKPVLYATGEEFLRLFGLTSLRDLPDLKEA